MRKRDRLEVDEGDQREEKEMPKLQVMVESAGSAVPTSGIAEP